MRQCVSGFQTDINLLCIDHCREGQIEQETGKGAYSYLEAGDLRIDQRIHHNGQVTFLLCHYHGIYISFQMELASKKIPAYIKGFSVRACLINKYCTNAHFVQYLFIKQALAQHSTTMYSLPWASTSRLPLSSRMLAMSRWPSRFR